MKKISESQRDESSVNMAHPHQAQQSGSTWGEGAILALLLVLALVLDALFLTGFYGSDDRSYLSAVINIAEYGVYQPGLAGVRLAVVLPYALVLSLTGSIGAVIASGGLYHIGLVLIAYLLGKILHNRLTALTAAFLTATSPLCYQYAMALLPDLALSFWFGLWLLLFAVLCVNKPKLILGRFYSQLFITLLVLAGFVNGIAYSAKISGLLLTVPAGLGILYFAGLNIKRIFLFSLAYAAGLIGFFVFETAAFVLLTENFSYWTGFELRLEKVFGAGDHLKDLMSRDGRTPLERLARADRLLQVWLHASTLPALILLAIYPFYRSASRFLWIAVAWFALYQVIGSTSFTEYRPSSLVDRYFAVFVVPGAIMASHVIFTTTNFIAHILSFLKLRVRSLLSAAAILFLVVWSYQTIQNDIPSAGKNFWGGEESRTSLRAITHARSNYGEYPLFLSKYIVNQFSPYLSYQAPADVHFDLNLENPPKMPFVLIAPTNPGYGDKTLETLKAQLLENNSGSFRFLEALYPPSHRINGIKDRLQDYLVAPITRGKRHIEQDYRHGMALYLFEKSETVEKDKVLFDSRRGAYDFVALSSGCTTTFRNGIALLKCLTSATNGAKFLLHNAPYSGSTYRKAVIEIPESHGVTDLKILLRSLSENENVKVLFELYQGQERIKEKTETVSLTKANQIFEMKFRSKKHFDGFSVQVVFEKSSASTAQTGVIIEQVTLDVLPPRSDRKE